MILSSAVISEILSIYFLSAIAFCVGLGFFVWSQDKKSVRNILFGLLTLSATIWFFGSYMMMRNCANEESAVFWDRFLYIGVIPMPVIIFHLACEFTQKIKEEKYKKLVKAGYGISLLFLFVSRTPLFIKGIFRHPWGCHSIAQIGHHIFLIPFFFYIFLFLYVLFDCYRNTKDNVLKIQCKYVLISLVFLTFSSIEFLPAYEIGIFPIGYFFVIIWLLILAYTIVRYQLLNIKVITTDIFVGAIVFIVFIFTTLSETGLQWMSRGIFFVSILVFGWLVIEGTHQEVQEKKTLEEKVQERTRELKEAKVELEKSKSALESKVQERTKELEELTKNLNKQVEEKTKNLQEKIIELEKFQKLAVDREMRMIELKGKIKKLKEELREGNKQ